MGFLCCICREDLAKKLDSNDNENGKGHERPWAATKCGHLFHIDCLKSWFEEAGPNAWATKKCPIPKCNMSITFATDVIRIFAHSTDDGSPTIEDYKRHITKLESAQTLLSNNLEMSFLRGRDQEKKNHQMTRDLEKLQKAYILEKTKAQNFQSEVAKLTNENGDLKNMIINLNKALMTAGNGNNGIQLQYSAMYNNNGVRMYPNSGVPTGFLDNNYSNHLAINNNSTNVTLDQHQQQVHNQWPPQQQQQSLIASSKPNNININNGGQIMTASSNNNVTENSVPLYMDNNNYSNNNNIQGGTTNNVELISSMFQGIMGLPSNGVSLLPTLYDDRDFKSSLLLDENSSSLDSDSSRTDSELGDNTNSSNNNNNNSSSNSISHATTIGAREPIGVAAINHHGATSAIRGGSNTISVNSNMNNILVDNGSSIANGLKALGDIGGNDQTPTDELMDAILLQSKSSKTANTTTDDYVIQGKNLAPKIAGKGKTKWKTYEYDDDKKMYGKFACKNCQAKWGTARHTYNQSQTCLKCNETVFPYDQGPVMSKEELAQQKLARSRKQ